MRIGIDCRLWNETGVGRYIRNLVEQLLIIDRKNDYVLFVRTRDYESIKRSKWQMANGKSQIVACDVHWHSVEEQIKFPQILNKENLDLMHFPYFSLPIFYNKPFVVTIHDLIINHFPTGKASTLPYPLYLAKRVGYDVVMSHAVKNSRKIIVPLSSVKDDLIKTYSIADKKIAVTYEGVDARVQGTGYRVQKQKAKPSTLNPKPYFLYVGNAYPHKNLEFLIKAFTEFRQETRDDIKLILVGKDDYFYKKFRKKVEDEKIENVIFKHDVSDEELFSLYSKAIAFISASKMEGFGLPPLEAMSASCPVILSNIPAFKEVCKDTAFYFDFNSIDSLKEQMKLVYNLEHKEKQEHIKKGLLRVKNFSWKRMAEETLEIYESCFSL